MLTLTSGQSLQVNTTWQVIDPITGKYTTVSGSEIIASGSPNVYMSGVTAVDGVIVNSGADIQVFAGGVATGTTVNNGGSENVFAGGVESGGTVNSGGRLNYDITTASLNAFNSLHIDSAANLYIDIESGVTVSGLVFNDGQEHINSGGVANGTTLNNGGWLPVSGGAVVNNTTVNSGGAVDIFSDAVANHTTLNYGAKLYVETNGLANGITVNSGAEVQVYAGGLVKGGIIKNGGLLQFDITAATFASFKSLTINSGAILRLDVESGVSISGLTINPGGQETINNGGIANGTTVNANGTLAVSKGGVANTTTLNQNAVMNIYGGTANNTVVNFGAKLYIAQFYNGSGVANATVVNSGGWEYVYRGGMENGGTINSGGGLYFDITSNSQASFNSLHILNGALLQIGVGTGVSVSGLTIVNSGSESIYSGGVANTTTINSGGWEYVYSGGAENGGIINSGGGLYFDITSKTLSSFNSLHINSGAILQVDIESGVSVSGLTIDSGGTESVWSGGVVNATMVNSGGWEIVYRGGLDNGGIINSGGGLRFDITSSTLSSFNNIHTNSGAILQVDIESGVAVSGLVLVNSGSEAIHSGGVANGTLVSMGGSATVSAGGVANNTTVSQGGWEYVQRGGMENGGTINSGGGISFDITTSTLASFNSLHFNSGAIIRVTVAPGVSVSGVTLESGGSVWISAGGVANNTQVNSGGWLYIYSGGVANGSVINSGGWESINGWGVENGGTINSGGGLDFDISTQTLSAFNNLHINNGAILRVSIESGVSISGLTIVNSGFQFVYKGGIANGTTIDSGGWSYISAGGVANGTIVNSGGTETVNSGGIENGGTINSGGKLEFDIAPRTLSAFKGIHINSGAILNVVAEQYVAVSGLDIVSGGKLGVYDGASASNSTLHSGGVVEFYGSAGTDSSVIFIDGGLLKLDDPYHFTAPISGFDSRDSIDLRYVSNVVSSSWNNGILTITQANGYVIKLTLVGSNYQKNTFITSSDGDYGTLIAVQGAVIPTAGTVSTFLTYLGKLGASLFTFTDNTANIAANLDALQAAVSHINTIVLSNSGIAQLLLNSIQLINDASVLAKIASPYQIVVASVSTNALSAALNNTHVSKPLQIADTATHIMGALDAIQAAGNKVASIHLTDSSVPTLAITATQYWADRKALAKVLSADSYRLNISNETVANLSKDLANNTVTSVSLLDSAAHIGTALSTLQTNISKLSGITLTDKAIPTLSLTAVQTASDLSVLNTIQSSYQLSVKDTVANINKLSLTGVHTGLIEIMPTALTANLALTENSKITNLNLSQIKLAGYYITEKAYHVTGTEIDIISNKGVLAQQFIFTADTESQLHLLGIGNTVVHVMM